ncbi:MAG: hypothetical protein JKY94_00985 [Rhodobacteraceae bacterium]|nr:hypothetical protein [Paracoccaceae bacterium]
MAQSSVPKEPWHLNRGVSIGIIILLAFYLVSAVALVSKMDGRINHLETQDKENREVNKIVYGLGSTIEAMKESIDRIEQAVVRP